eukprot:2567375-Prymnesium_polylepis.2
MLRAYRICRPRAGASTPGAPPLTASRHERASSQLSQLLILLSSIMIDVSSSVMPHDNCSDLNAAAGELPAA